MKFLINKKNGNIYKIKSSYFRYVTGQKCYNLQRLGEKRIMQYSEDIVNKNLKEYKPGFFKKIYFMIKYR